MRKANKLMLAAVLAVALPTGALAAEADLQVKIDKLTQQMEDLKGQVERIEDKSLGKWLQIGGSYQFRVDSLHGKTVPYSSAIGTMGNLVGNFLLDPTVAVPTNPATSSMAYMLQTVSGSLFSPAQFNTIMSSYMPKAMTNAFFGNSATGSTPYSNLGFDNKFSSIAILNGGRQAVTNNTIAYSFFKTFTSPFTGQPMSDAEIAQFNAMAGNPAQQAAFQGMMMQMLNMPLNATQQGYLQGTSLTSQQQKIMATLQSKVIPQMQLNPAQQNLFNMLMGQGLPPGATVNPQYAQMAFQMMMQGFMGATSGNLAQVAAYKPKNETLYTNKFALDLKAKATKDVTVNVKLGMYKVFGSQDNTATANGDFADRVGVFDGVLGHVPSSSYLNVDRAYATWSNIMDQPVWFSVGRRPATDGAPTNLKSNNERPGNGGTPALLVNYAFDGMTLGYAPDIDMLPGFYAKVCYGRGFDSGYVATPSNSLKDTDMLGVAIIPIDTDPLRVWMQWNRGFDIFDFPVMNNTIFGNTAPSVSLGAIDWFGIGAMSTLKKVGPGDLNLFVDTGMSITYPRKATSANAGYQGLLSGEFFAEDTNPKSQTGYAVFAGLRYDLPSKTKIGFEYNWGSKYWITFAPAADDMWTSKVGTRGQVFEPYVIQELDLKPISSVFAKTFFKIGYQYYDFQYTGSNNWVGAPVKISDIKPTDLMLMAPVKEAHNIYGTFEVHF